jgi:hypothetical protein
VPRGASPKRERQYEHIKDSVQQRGESPERATEIAPELRTRNSRAGESRTASKTSTQDISSSRRGGLRSHAGAAERTKDHLYAEARKRNIKGRSTMTKRQLESAIT